MKPYFEDLQHNLKLEKARRLVSSASTRVFDDLDNDRLEINDITQHLQFAVHDISEREIKDVEVLRQRRAQRAQQKIEQIRTLSHNRQLQLEKATENYKEVLQKKPLFICYQEKDAIENLNLLNERKMKLEQIRDLHRPLDKSQFLQHRERIEKYKSEHVRHQRQSLSPQVFEKSEFYIRVTQDELNRSQEQADKIRHKKELVDRKYQYAEMVKQNYKPNVKVRQIQSVSNRKTQNISDSDAHRQTKEMTFLSEQRPLRAVNEWERVHNDPKLSYLEKSSRIIDAAHKLEDIAMKEEQLQRVRGVYSDHIDSYLIGSIKAKLSLLSQ